METVRESQSRLYTLRLFIFDFVDFVSPSVTFCKQALTETFDTRSDCVSWRLRGRRQPKKKWSRVVGYSTLQRVNLVVLSRRWTHSVATVLLPTCAPCLIHLRSLLHNFWTSLFSKFSQHILYRIRTVNKFHSEESSRLIALKRMAV